MDREEFKQRFLQAQMNPIYFYIYLRKNENYVKPLILTETDKYLSSMEDLQDCIIVDVSDLTEVDNNTIIKGEYVYSDYNVSGFNIIIIDYDYTDDADIVIRIYDKVNYMSYSSNLIISSGDSKNILYTRPSKYSFVDGQNFLKRKNDNYGYYINYNPNRTIFTLSNVPYGDYTIYMPELLSNEFQYIANQTATINYDGTNHEYTLYLEPKSELRSVKINSDNEKSTYEYYFGQFIENDDEEDRKYEWEFLGIINYKDINNYLDINNYNPSKYISEGSTITFEEIIKIYNNTVIKNPENNYFHKMYWEMWRPI